MTRHIVLRVTVLLLLMGAGQAYAKAPTVKLAVSGPGIEQSVELTEKDAISANVWGGSFMDRQREMAEAPASGLPRYTVEFYVRLSDSDVRMMYVVYYVWDYESGRALVQIPGPSDKWYWHNVSTISRCCAGKWFYASTLWAESIRRVLPSTQSRVQASRASHRHPGSARNARV
jgi:hypothetical protein